MNSHLLLFDIGNTNIKVGVANGQGLLESYSLPTDPRCTADDLGLRLTDLARHFLTSRGLACEGALQPEAVLACSVSPSMDPLLRKACRRFFDSEVRFVNQDLSLPLENRYERPREVGADRLLSAFAGRALYPAPAHIVIDFGTATTFDCVQGAAYLGGLICPGLLSSARALSSQTAKLPQITLEVDSEELVIGRSTSDSLNQGLLFGFSAMVEGLTAKLKPLLGGEAMVIATGGFGRAVARLCPAIDHVRPDLLLEGLRLLYSAPGTQSDKHPQPDN